MFFPGTKRAGAASATVMAFVVLLGAWLEVGPGSYAPPPRRPPPPPPAAVRVDYDESLARLEKERRSLSRRYAAAATEAARDATIADARATLFDALTREIIPAWYGTRWSYHGTSETPGSGAIACGYFVATVLRDAGFEIDRVPLAQKGSADIVETLVPASEVIDLDGATPGEVLEAAREGSGNGLFVIGFDSHVGLLVVRDRGSQLCHSSNRSPKSVRCEPALGARSMVSSRHVLGPVLSDEAVAAWLQRPAITLR